MPDVFTNFLHVQKEDIDHLDHVNNLVYLQWAGRISKLHWENLVSAERRKPLLWVMGRQEIDYLKELKAGGHVRIETFVERCEKQKCFRTILFYNNITGELAAKAQIVWVLLDAFTKKPMRVPEDLIKLFNEGAQ